MFATDGDQTPSIEPDVFGNRLLVRGTSEQLAQVKTLLTQLGEDRNPNTRRASNSDPVRTFSLDSRDPKELLPLIEKLWNRAGNNPIFIVTPNANRKPVVKPHLSGSEITPKPETPQESPPEPETKQLPAKALPQKEAHIYLLVESGKAVLFSIHGLAGNIELSSVI